MTAKHYEVLFGPTDTAIVPTVAFLETLSGTTVTGGSITFTHRHFGVFDMSVDQAGFSTPSTTNNPVVIYIDGQGGGGTVADASMRYPAPVVLPEDQYFDAAISSRADGSLFTSTVAGRIDAAISTRSTLTQAQVVDSGVPLSSSNINVRVDAAISSRATQTSVDDVQTDVTSALTALANVKKIQEGRWKIDSTAKTLTLYETDGTTAYLVFDLKNAAGVATATGIFERVPQP